jgi:hypothetical protein
MRILYDHFTIPQAMVALRKPAISTPFVNKDVEFEQDHFYEI